MLPVLLGQIPEAIYFSLFMILTKELKQKRILFIILMILEYLLLKQVFKFNIYFQVSYTIFTYIILKVLYKDKSQITDIFTFAIASILLILIDVPLYFIIYPLTNNYILYVIIERIIIFSLLFLFRNKMNNIQKTYKKLWNRDDSKAKKIKTTTFRSLNVVLFNLSFCALNVAILYCIYRNSFM